MVFRAYVAGPELNGYMVKNHSNHDALPGSAASLGPVTRALVHARTQELASIAGRAPEAVTQSDYEQAKRELTGESDLDRQNAILDAWPETPRVDSAPGFSREDSDVWGRSNTPLHVAAGLSSLSIPKNSILRHETALSIDRQVCPAGPRLHG